NIVFDHVSVSWEQDEGIANGSAGGIDNVTIWRSIVAEGIIHATGSDNCSGGGLSGGHGGALSGGHNSMFQSVLSPHHERNWLQSDGGDSGYVANNIFYMGYGQGILFSDAYGGPSLASAVGNYFRRDSEDLSYLSMGPLAITALQTDPASQIYL